MKVISEEEFVDLIKEKKEYIFKLARGVTKNYADAEDVMAETVLTVWQYRDRIHDIDNFDAWLYKITVNKAISMIYKRNREIPVEDEIFDDYKMEVDNNKLIEIWEYVYKLKAKYTKIILLYYYENRSIKEISTITGLSEGTVKSRLHRARNMLKKIIPDELYECYKREVH